VARAIVKVGILDIGISVTATIACARLADVLGFSRYWLAEHYALSSAWASPEIVIAMLAMHTKKIRLGSAGTLLNYHNPLQVACDFRLLASLCSNRIDLGIARGDPAWIPNREALRGDDSNNYEARLADIIRLLSQTNDDFDPHASIAIPRIAGNHGPEIWILGKTVAAAETAKRLGLAYSHGVFLEPSQADLIDFGARSNLAIAGLCGFAKDEVALDRNTIFRSSVIGNAEQCVDKFEELCAAHEVSEVIFLDLASTQPQRCRTLVQLAAELSKRGLMSD
jgi:alkanesulfonate monooxygenase SsuD/methylene tetrahydromethanopterin reductase-like flavin-dependent oxidoreductase (luciferase family)